jgi:hypothetical protein
MFQGGALASIRISGAPRDPRTLRNSTRQGLLWGQDGPAMSPFEPEMSPFAPFRCHYSASEPFWVSTFDPNVHFAIGTRAFSSWLAPDRLATPGCFGLDRVRGHGTRDRNGRALPALNIPAYFSIAIQSNPPQQKQRPAPVGVCRPRSSSFGYARAAELRDRYFVPRGNDSEPQPPRTFTSPLTPALGDP